MQNRDAGKSIFAQLMLSAALLPALFDSSAAFAGALPSQGHFTSGVGTIAKSGGTLSVNQTSVTGIVNWNSFSVGARNSVNFQNGSGATLNRVTGGNMSKIAGSLSATGSLYLMNRSGVIVSGTGRVVTGGSFVASSGDTADAAFDPTKKLLITNADGRVVNHGSIVSSHGDVMLVGNTVRNSGTLSAKNGTAGLAAGTSVVIAPSGDQRIQVLAGTGNATNSGAIDAASAELRAANGNVYALAGNKGGVINATGTTTEGGHIWLTSQQGKTAVSGTLTAQSGEGRLGSIETSGSSLKLNHATIDAGEGGQWTVDPENLVVGRASATVIDRALGGGTDVTLKTTANGTSGNSIPYAGDGDIVFKSGVTWSTDATLTLDAYHSVVIESTFNVKGHGGLHILTDDGGSGGELAFEQTGAVNFGNLDSDLNINGASYVLVPDIKTLAAEANKHPKEDIALARNYDASGDGSYADAPISGEFRGIFEGLGHSIAHFNMYDTQGSQAALFAALSKSAEIRDFGLIDTDILSENDFFAEVGALAGVSYGKIENSFATGAVRSDFWVDIGGLVGVNYGAITASYANVSVMAAFGEAGGLAGNNHGPIRDTYAIGDVEAGDRTDDGGLIGYNLGHIYTSYATGDVSGGQDSVVGALIGESLGGGVSDSYWLIKKTKIAGIGYDGNGGGAGAHGLFRKQFQQGLPAGFSSDAWGMDSAINRGLPYLKTIIY